MTLVSEKNFLERLADRIPGLAGYRAREARRDTDKRLREHLARRLDRGRENLDRARRELLSGGELGRLDGVGGVDKRLQRAADGLRHASYGYSGLFDALKIREEELDRLYRYDGELLDEVEGVERALQAVGGEPDPEGLTDLSTRVDRLLERIAGRREIFETPAG
ncbi:MAG: hypothetical protein PVF68_16635 [Acidobacteriota bacterium]|jgi:hypothetical protein